MKRKTILISMAHAFSKFAEEDDITIRPGAPKNDMTVRPGSPRASVEEPQGASPQNEAEFAEPPPSEYPDLPGASSARTSDSKLNENIEERNNEIDLALSTAEEILNIPKPKFTAPSKDIFNHYNNSLDSIYNSIESIKDTLQEVIDRDYNFLMFELENPLSELSEIIHYNEMYSKYGIRVKDHKLHLTLKSLHDTLEFVITLSRSINIKLNRLRNLSTRKLDTLKNIPMLCNDGRAN